MAAVKTRPYQSKFCDTIVLLGLASVLIRHRVYLAVEQQPQHAREEDRHAEIQKHRCGQVFGDSSASDQGARARRQYETTGGAEDPHRGKKSRRCCIRARGSNQPTSTAPSEIKRRGAEMRPSPSIALVDSVFMSQPHCFCHCFSPAVGRSMDTTLSVLRFD